jgi:hypothetical protein
MTPAARRKSEMVREMCSKFDSFKFLEEAINRDHRRPISSMEKEKLLKKINSRPSNVAARNAESPVSNSLENGDSTHESLDKAKETDQSFDESS